VNGSTASACAAKAEAIAVAMSLGMKEGDRRGVRDVIDGLLFESGLRLSDQTSDVVENRNSHQGHQRP